LVTPPRNPNFVLQRDKKIPLIAAGLSVAALVGSLLSLGLVIVSGLAVPESAADGLLYGFAFAGPFISGFCIFFFLARAASKDPILKLDMRGIYTSHCKVGHIPWIDVSTVSENAMQSGSLLVIHLRDPVKYYNKLTGVGQAAVQMDIRNLDGITIPEKVLPLTVAETIDAIRGIVDDMVAANPTRVTVHPQPQVVP
jgi:hypothetical protein